MRLRVFSDGSTVSVKDTSGNKVEDITAIEFTWSLGEPPLLKLTFVSELEFGFHEDTGKETP